MAVDAVYMEYIQWEEWNKKRKAVLDRADYACERCGARVPLSVHHKHYKNFKNEDMDDLEALCDDCHENADIERKARAYENQMAGFGRKLYGRNWRVSPGVTMVRYKFEKYLQWKKDNP